MGGTRGGSGPWNQVTVMVKAAWAFQGGQGHPEKPHREELLLLPIFYQRAKAC